MLAVITAGLAPGLALLSYFYLRDRYDAEPISMVFRIFVFGAILVFPIMFLQYILEVEQVFTNGFTQAFLGVSILEEFFKWFVLYYTVFQHIEFDEPYDGIVYGAAVSLGFATLENILYLLVNGVQFAIGRALLPVSSHALFGVVMGYYLGKAKFSPRYEKRKWVFFSFLFPFSLHGIYDYILITLEQWLYYMLPFMLFLWWFGLRKVKIAKS
ncbi:glutamic-type intramembrane protease PrsW [Fredinandcohnia sp. 179-A 10B2 NHS]|uniref:glutamic-type intramembrane protease PrsW n=1 Tax=Fredinandcohnia sp. 179-A 10B2 NHS TaxID=3235176 RepID=UPI00399FAFE1